MSKPSAWQSAKKTPGCPGRVLGVLAARKKRSSNVLKRSSNVLAPCQGWAEAHGAKMPGCTDRVLAARAGQGLCMLRWWQSLRLGARMVLSLFLCVCLLPLVSLLLSPLLWFHCFGSVCFPRACLCMCFAFLFLFSLLAFLCFPSLCFCCSSLCFSFVFSARRASRHAARQTRHAAASAVQRHIVKGRSWLHHQV